MPAKIFQMGLGDQSVEIHSACLIFRKNDHMIGGQFFHRVFALGPILIELRQIMDAFFL